MALRLDGARRTVNRLMSDACVIRRDQDHKASATLDEETGLLEAEAGAPVVYRGQCMVVPSGLQARGEEPGGMEGAVNSYKVSIPSTAKEVRPGDEVTITKAVDKTAVGKTFVVRDVPVTSFPVARQFTVETLRTSRG